VIVVVFLSTVTCGVLKLLVLLSGLNGFVLIVFWRWHVMAETGVQTVNLPGLGAVPVVAIRLPDGTIALRHPSELVKQPAQTKISGGG